MRHAELEGWVRQIVDVVISGRPVEDDKIEMKAGWIDEGDASRRLAAHANTAKGEPILWLIGVDERGRRVSGANPVEMANWLSRLAKHFDGEAPSLITHVNVYLGSETIVALYFRTDVGAPFVIKNPKGGYPEFEVPWREGTRLRAAKRSELLTMLLPSVRAPEVKLTSLQLSLNVTHSIQVPYGDPKEHKFDWVIKADLYITPRSAEAVTFPNINCNAFFSVSDYHLGQACTLPISFKPIGESSTVKCATTEVIFLGPGSVCLEARGFLIEDFAGMLFNPPRGLAQINVQIMAANTSENIVMERQLQPVIDDSFWGKLLSGNKRIWML